MKQIVGNEQYDLIVIGSGVSGSSAALLAAQTKQKVALVEMGELGGASANYADVPVSVFARSAQLFEQAKRASKLGLRSETISHNFPSIRLFKDQAIKQTQVTTPKFYSDHNISLIRGRAQFINQHTISVDGKHYSAKKFIIATGASWKRPKIANLDQVDYLTPDQLINLPKPPRSLFVVGGDRAGVETSQIMASFGTKVFITTISTRLLPDYDEEVGDFMERYLSEKYQMIISTSSRVSSINKDSRGWRVRFNHAGIDKEVVVEQVLLASGKEPNTDLGLENAGVAYTIDGINVDANLQTSNHNVFACGAVIDLRQNASHISTYQARIAINNALRLTKPVPVDYHLMPNIIKTTPKIASVGLSEDDCNRQGLEYFSANANFKETPYSLISPDEMGFVKLITNRRKQIIGATVLAESADLIIQELVLAIKSELSAQDLASLPRSFLSVSEALAIASEKLL